MSWVKRVFSGPVGKKFLMSLTGLFLITFLVIHLIGNLQLLYNDGGYAFNAYAVFMTSNPLIKTVSYVLYASILLHAIVSLVLTLKNQKARPQRYKANNPAANSFWASRNMGILGTIILIFLVVHMKGFWFEYKWGYVPYAKYEVAAGQEISKVAIPDDQLTEEIKAQEGVYRDLYLIVKEAFQVWWIVALYVLSMVALAFHLSHGFQSAFQTLGINHKAYTPFIKKVGVGFSVIIPALFALIPLYFFFIK